MEAETVAPETKPIELEANPVWDYMAITGMDASVYIPDWAKGMREARTERESRIGSDPFDVSPNSLRKSAQNRAEFDNLRFLCGVSDPLAMY